jgi:hypothetical protein
MSNMVAGLIAYAFLPKKPSIAYETTNSSQLALF